MCPPRTNSSNPGCRRRPSLPYSDRLGGEKAISCQINSSQVKSSQVKTLPHNQVEPNLNHGQDTRANRTRNTTRSSTRNHTQNSNQVCMSLRSAVEAPTCISLNEYMYVPRFLTPNPPDSVEVCRSASGVRADAGSDVCLLGLRWEQDVGGAGLRGPGRVSTLEPLSTTLHGRAPVHGVPVPVQMPGRTFIVLTFEL